MANITYGEGRGYAVSSWHFDVNGRLLLHWVDLRALLDNLQIHDVWRNRLSYFIIPWVIKLKWRISNLSSNFIGCRAYLCFWWWNIPMLFTFTFADWIGRLVMYISPALWRNSSRPQCQMQTFPSVPPEIMRLPLSLQDNDVIQSWIWKYMNI